LRHPAGGRRGRFIKLAAAIALSIVLVSACSVAGRASNYFIFVVAADMRNFTGETEFAGAAKAIASAGAGEFMISPGDIDPPDQVYDVIRSSVGAAYPWYPVAGNHEAETTSDMAWLRAFNSGGNSLPHIVNPGPVGSMETSFSFDYENAHFVIINEYFDGATDNGGAGDVIPALLAWLEADLTANTLPIVFVVGHEPAFPQPDAAPPYRLRHDGDSLDAFPTNRDAFWSSLAAHGVKAYICGHTHNYSTIKIDGVWQMDVGHARGMADTGAPSTFIKITVWKKGAVTYETYRQNLTTSAYEVAETGIW
jgi:hypothetical protein